MKAMQFIDALSANAGTSLTTTERKSIIEECGGRDATLDREARARVLRIVAESRSLYEAERSRAFVLMLYFGYLRRNPDDSPESDYTGYDFWLTKLNNFEGNFQRAEMIQAFLTSDEYKARFDN